MSNKTEWWREFFPGPWGEAIQAHGYPEAQTRKEVDFLISALELGKEDTILDIACGTGRHCIELARRGYDTTGIDFNRSALATATRAAIDAGIQPRFLELDMRDLRAREAYDVACCLWTSFGYFSDDENLAVASRIFDALRPGGRFLVDTVVTETLFPTFQPYLWNWADQARTTRVLQECKWDPISGRVETMWSFVREDGHVETAHSSLRVYSYRELHTLLEDAGFHNLKSSETGTGGPFRVGSRRLSIIAHKPSG